MGLRAFIPRSGFLHNVWLLTSGTVFAQGLVILALPVLTRLYSPQDFDLLAVYVALIGLISVVSCLRYNIAIPLPEQDEDAMALLALSLLAGCAFSLILVLPVIFAPEATAALLGQMDLAPHLWLVPFGIALASSYNALQYWASRKKRFGIITKTRMTRAVGGVGTQLAFGLTTPIPFGLLLGHALYSGLGVIGLGRNVMRDDHKTIGALDWERMRRVAGQYRRFPFYSVPQTLFDTGGTQLPIIIIAAATAGPEAGFLMLAMRVMGLPMGLIGSSVAQVYLAEAPEKLRDGSLPAFTRRTMWTLFRTGAPPLAVAGALSPMLFPILFGAEWARAGWLVAWMTPWFILQFVVSPVSMVLNVTGRLGLLLAIALAGLLLRVAVVLWAIVAHLDIASEIYAVSGALFYAIYLSAILWTLNKTCAADDDASTSAKNQTSGNGL